MAALKLSNQHPTVLTVQRKNEELLRIQPILPLLCDRCLTIAQIMAICHASPIGFTPMQVSVY